MRGRFEIDVFAEGGDGGVNVFLSSEGFTLRSV